MSYKKYERFSKTCSVFVISLFLLVVGFNTQLSEADEILIGTEYILLEHGFKVFNQASQMADAGIPTAKHYVEHVQWDQMQPTETSPIDYTKLDWFVKIFQEKGFTDLIISLKSRHALFSKDVNYDHTPKTPDLEDLYANWVSAVVERYDNDGTADMEGLKYPVVYYEIGNEFSSYEPETADDYIRMLERAYEAAHQAYDEVLVAHAAFLMLDVFKNNPTPDEYDDAFATSEVLTHRDSTHGLADIRQVLARPDIYDLYNIHALGYPTEIEQMVNFLKHEWQEEKPIIISDTATSAYIAFGEADSCDEEENTLLKLGLMLHPAKEENNERCDIAEYFQNLLAKDQDTIAWVQAFSAEDNVKKVVIAAEQDISLINTSFTTNLFLQTLPFLHAGAGNSAWSGQIDLGTIPPTKRAPFYALKQVAEFLKGYDDVTKLLPNATTIGTPFEKIRLYQVSKSNFVGWVMWYEPDRVYLPGESVPTLSLPLNTGPHKFTVRKAMTYLDEQTKEPIEEVNTWEGLTTAVLTPTPIYITIE